MMKSASLFFLSATLFAQTITLPKGVTRGPSVEGITEYRLDNGLQVLLFPDPSKETITVNMTYLVGSKHENYGETGMAHLLEHMVFKGSPKHTDIPKELSEHGSRPNGSTSFDRTNYFETFRASDENLKWALDLEADRMVNSFIRKTDLDSEMTVVRNEFEMGENNPVSILLERVMSTAYLWHNYGKSTIGSRSDIEHVPIERLQAFYKRNYQPDNAVLLVAGKIDEAKLIEQINNYFSPIPKPTRVLSPAYTEEPTQDGERSVTLRRTGEVQVVIAGYHFPAGSSPDYAPLDVLVQVLTTQPSGRLYKALVETKKAASTSGFDYQLREPGMGLFFAQVRKEQSIDAARDAMLEALHGVVTTPPTEAEVTRGRTELLKQMELELNNSENVGLDLSEWEGMGDWRLFFLHRDRIAKVTAADVLRVAKLYLKDSNMTTGTFLPTAKPDRTEIPATPDLVSTLKDYKGNAAVATGEAFDPSPKNIDSRTIRGVLQPGIKMAFISKKTRGNSVVATMSLHFGDEKSLQDRSMAATMAGAMLMRGTTKHTREQIKDEFDRLKAVVQVTGSATGASVNLETTRENLPAVLALVAEVLREPAFPEKEFEQVKQARLAGLEQQKTEPNAIAQLALMRHLNVYPKGDPRYVRSTDESIADVKAVTLDDAKKFYKDFYGASNAELAVVGDFEAESLQQSVSKLFGDWKSPKPFQILKREYKSVEAVNQAIETPDKANSMFMAGLPVDITDESKDYPALVLGNYMLGGGFLNSRLATRIRVKDGLSYGVASMLSAPTKSNGGQFMVYAIAAPQNVAKVEADFKEEIARALKDGFTPEEISAAKSGWLQDAQVSRSQDNELMHELASERFWDRTMAYDAELATKISALTSQDIVEALRRHIDISKVSIYKAGDFAKAATAK
jgi:zinc protease